MGWKEAAEPVLTRMPTVARPEGHVPFKRKLLWTASVLMVYFFLTNIPLFGLGGQGSDIFGQFRSIIAGGQGSVLQVGIGPIVTASIVLQLLGGANLLGLDTDNDPRDQILYQGLQKFLVVVMTVLTAAPMVFSGGFLPANQALGQSLGVGTFGVQLIIFAQVFVGGILILFLDEIVSKWGVGSGVGLFIIAGVSQQLIGGILSWQGLGTTTGILASWYGILFGDLSLGPTFTGQWFQGILFDPGSILALFTTLLLPAILGQYSDGQPIGGLFYYLAPIQSRADWMWFLGLTPGGIDPWQIGIRVGIDLIFMIVGGAVFAIFWVETTGMGPEATAEQIQDSGMQIPGFRRNPQVVEKVMERYIPQVTVIGGALVGLLAVMANMLGTIGNVSGTGLLLTVSITYKLYEEIAEEQLMEMHPMMRQMFGNE